MSTIHAVYLVVARCRAPGLVWVVGLERTEQHGADVSIWVQALYAQNTDFDVYFASLGGEPAPGRTKISVLKI